MRQKTNVYRLTGLALLFALSVVLMLLENMIPPLPALPPGVKLGLSNIAVMYCLFYMGKENAFILLVLKSLFVFLTRHDCFLHEFCRRNLFIFYHDFVNIIEKTKSLVYNNKCLCGCYTQYGTAAGVCGNSFRNGCILLCAGSRRVWDFDGNCDWCFIACHDACYAAA